MAELEANAAPIWGIEPTIGSVIWLVTMAWNRPPLGLPGDWSAVYDALTADSWQRISDMHTKQ